MPLALFALLLATAPPESPLEGVSVSFAFEPRVGSYAALDSELRVYDFAPVRSPYLTAFGLRGRTWLDNGLLIELMMTYGIGTADPPGSLGSPTVTTSIDTAAGVGYMAPFGLFASGGLGFGVLTQAVSSTSEGGALVYRAPLLHPRIGYALLRSAWFGAISAGYLLHFPIGDAHQQPLWGEPFERTMIHAFTIGIESGFGWAR